MGTAKELNARMIGMKPGGSAYRVLIIDDEKIIRNLMSRVLKSVGFDVVGEGSNGIEGVQLYKDVKPDIVTLDVMMPKMDGLTALGLIRKLDPTAKVIMLTSETDKELVTKILKAGASDYIVKPIDRKLIMEKFVRLMQNS